VTPVSLPHPVGGLAPSAGRTVAKPAAAGAMDVLPESVDLRQYAPAVSDQGQIGACVAWSIGYSIMGYWANRTNGAGAPYAPLFLYMRNVKPGGAPSAGLVADYVLANASSAGIDTQDHYWQGTTNWQQAPTADEIENAKNYKVNGWSRLFNGSNQGAGAQSAIMQTLASGSPVALGMPVYKDFMYLRSHSLYSTTSGSNLGGHMVAAYGYDAQGVWIRNSWGTGWGNSGDAKLSWSFITKQATSAFAVNGVTTPAETVPLAPSVAALSIVKGGPGAKVTITGSGLAEATGVSFGGTAATFEPTVVAGTTKLIATVPVRAAGVVDLTVTNATGTSKAAKFTMTPPAPGITTLDPATVTTVGGRTVTLTGTDLKGVTSVRIGTTTAPARAVTATSLSFVAPVRPAGTYPVTVANTYGTSTPAGEITYVLPPAPEITTVTPSTGLTYRTTPVVVTGINLTAATVTLDGKAISFTKVSDTQIKLTMPKHAAGAAALKITTPGGSSPDAEFTYAAPPVPAITELSPSSGLTYVRTPVVITGSGFTDASKVTAGGTAVTFTKVSDTQIKLTLPVRSAGLADIQITTPGGVSTVDAAAQFRYEAPPVPAITELSPSSGLTYARTPVVITGSGLTGVTKVTAGGTVVPFTKVSDTQIKLTLPVRSAGLADIQITTPGGVSTVDAASQFRYNAPPKPEITSLNVVTASAKSTTTVLVKGTGLTGTTKVQLGTATLSFTNVTDEILKVLVPARPAGTTADLKVTTPGGTSAAFPVTFA
jgi:hypothetical protein